MREPERDKERLLHIMEAIDTIVCIPKQRNLSDLSTDKLFFWGVVKCIENIGEAANIYRLKIVLEFGTQVYYFCN